MTLKKELAHELTERTKRDCAMAAAKAVQVIAERCELDPEQINHVLEVISNLAADITKHSLDLSIELVRLEEKHYGR